MARWEPGAADRLRLAAMELFVARGYDETTVADIAAAAGVTERTFFRYYADKREVLFGGQERLHEAFAGAVATSRATRAIDVALAPVHAAGEMFTEERRPWSRERAVVIAANTPLQERELLKMGALTVVVSEALQSRGFDPVTASVAAHAGVGAFRETFRQWVTEGTTQPWGDIADAVVATARTLAA